VTNEIELAHRESGGTHVALLWSREDARLTVSVVGAGEADSFELDAAKSSALDVFYAYAARREAGCQAIDQTERGDDE
jgi:hypothetical protein